MKAHKPNTGMPSQRQLRVGEQLRHIVAQTLQRGHFNHQALLDAHFITVTEVKVTPDLKLAKVYVRALGDEDMSSIIPALNEDAHIFQKEINRQSELKFTPKVRFVIDDSFDNARRIDEILRGVHIPDSEQS
jgi:ribosome-binding factor A